jgi:hypothetical protein
LELEISERKARRLGQRAYWLTLTYIWRFLRSQKIDLSGRKSWCESEDPAFVAKAAEIVGLYMAPPENAVVLSVDEKPSIQALERAQGDLKLPTGRAMIGQSHDDKRHGTTTLFAALEVATGKVTGRHIWFSILSGKSLSGASFQNVNQLKTHIDSFIAGDNDQARPFVWTKSKVHQKRLKPCFADQRFWVLALLGQILLTAVVFRIPESTLE